VVRDEARHWLSEQRYVLAAKEEELAEAKVQVSESVVNGRRACKLLVCKTEALVAVWAGMKMYPGAVDARRVIKRKHRLFAKGGKHFAQEGGDGCSASFGDVNEYKGNWRRGCAR
jgi:hypothetical protein